MHVSLKFYKRNNKTGILVHTPIWTYLYLAKILIHIRQNIQTVFKQFFEKL